MKESDYKRYVIILIAISAAVRSLLAVFINLGGEEAYYWTFAQFPELGSFDQPPMIGWFIQLFTNNLALPGEFFLRLSSIITGPIITLFVPIQTLLPIFGTSLYGKFRPVAIAAETTLELRGHWHQKFYPLQNPPLKPRLHRP